MTWINEFWPKRIMTHYHSPQNRFPTINTKKTYAHGVFVVCKLYTVIFFLNSFLFMLHVMRQWMKIVSYFVRLCLLLQLISMEFHHTSTTLMHVYVDLMAVCLSPHQTIMFFFLLLFAFFSQKKLQNFYLHADSNSKHIDMGWWSVKTMHLHLPIQCAREKKCMKNIYQLG